MKISQIMLYAQSVIVVILSLVGIVITILALDQLTRVPILLEASYAMLGAIGVLITTVGVSAAMIVSAIRTSR